MTAVEALGANLLGCRVKDCEECRRTGERRLEALTRAGYVVLKMRGLPPALYVEFDDTDGATS